MSKACDDLFGAGLWGVDERGHVHVRATYSHIQFITGKMMDTRAFDDELQHFTVTACANVPNIVVIDDRNAESVDEEFQELHNLIIHDIGSVSLESEELRAIWTEFYQYLISLRLPTE